MKTKFIKENILILFFFVLIAFVGIFFFWKIGFENFRYIPLGDPLQGLKIIGVTIFITLVTERALEVLMNLWREPGKTVYLSQISDIDIKLKKLFFQRAAVREELERENLRDELLQEKKVLISRKESKIDELETRKEIAEGQLRGYRVVTKRYAHLTSFLIGVFVSLAGFGVLNEFFIYEEVANAISVNKSEIINTKEFHTECDFLDTTAILANHYASKINPPLQISTEKQEAQFLQYKIFAILNLLITALLISGGTDGMHKLAKLYTTFLTSTTRTIEEADHLRNQKT